MTAAPTAISTGRRALTAAIVAVAALSAGLSPTASASPAVASSSSSSSDLATEQAQATQLATQIRVQGRQVEQLSEQADAATIRVAEVEGSLAAARSRAAATAKALAAARALLAEQALDAYTEGGDATLAPMSEAAQAMDPSLIGAYGEIVAGTERDAITAFRLLRRKQTVEQAQLTAAVHDAQAAATQLRADRDAARAAASGQQATLAGIQGQMAILVADAQAAQAQATATQEKANLASQGQLPPSTPAVVTAAPVPSPASSPTPEPAPVPSPPSAPAPTPAPPTRATLVTAPPTTEAPTPTTAPAPPTPSPAPNPPPGNTSQAQIAIAYAQAQLGKPYQWGGAGPATFDCSGLVMDAYAAAGVYFPHLAQSQYDMTARVPLDQLRPGDLVFYGTPSDVYHVGIYIGGGDMIDAPAAGDYVRIENIYWSDLLSGGRVS